MNINSFARNAKKTNSELVLYTASGVIRGLVSEHWDDNKDEGYLVLTNVVVQSSQGDFSHHQLIVYVDNVVALDWN